MNLTEKYGQCSYAYLLEAVTPVRGDEEIKKLEQEVKSLIPDINSLITKLNNTPFLSDTNDKLHAQIVEPINKKMSKVIRVLGKTKRYAVSVMRAALEKISPSSTAQGENPVATAMQAAVEIASDAATKPENKQMAYRFKLVSDTLSKMSGSLDSNERELVLRAINQYLNARSAYVYFNTSVSQIRSIAFNDLIDKTPDTKVPPNEETERRINAQIADAKRKSAETEAKRKEANKKLIGQERGISRRPGSPDVLLKGVNVPEQAMSVLRKILSNHSLASNTDEIESKLNQLKQMLIDNMSLSDTLQNPGSILQSAIDSLINDKYFDLDELKDLQQKTETLYRANPGDNVLEKFNQILWDVVRDGNNLNTGATSERVAMEPEQLARTTYESLVKAIKKANEEGWDATFLTELDDYGQIVIDDWKSALGDSFGQFVLSDVITPAGQFKNRSTIEPITAKFFMLCMLWAIGDKKKRNERVAKSEKQKYERKHGPDLITRKLPESQNMMTFLQYITESEQLPDGGMDYDHPKIAVGINAMKAIRNNEHPNRNEWIQEIADFAKNDMSYGMARRLAVLLNLIAYGKTERESENAYKDFQKLQRQWEATTRASKVVGGMGDNADKREVFNDYLRRQWYVPSEEEGKYENAMIRPLYVGGTAGYTKEEIDILKNLGEPIIVGGSNVFVKGDGKTYRIHATFDHGWMFVENTENGTIAISTKEVPPTTEGDVRFE